MSRYLVDNSVLRRLPRSPEVQSALNAILDAEHDLCCCSLTLDEFAFSARSASEHAEGSHRLGTSFLYLPSSARSDEIVSEIRSALWQVGKSRAAGVIDVAIAATAVVSDAAVLHYDGDFDHIAGAYPTFNSQWVVSRGSIDWVVTT